MRRLKLALLLVAAMAVCFFAGHGLARMAFDDPAFLPAVLEPAQVRPRPELRYGFEGIAPRGGRVR